MTAPAQTIATIIPCLRYRNAPAAIEWLAAAFGFEPTLVVPGEDGTVVHAELRYGNGMIMLCSTFDDAWGARFLQPDQAEGRETQCCCVIVADPDAHHARAIAAGATLVETPKDNHYGGRGYTCRDPEGHLWTFSSYDPWRAPA